MVFLTMIRFLDIDQLEFKRLKNTPREAMMYFFLLPCTFDHVVKYNSGLHLNPMVRRAHVKPIIVFCLNEIETFLIDFNKTFG